MTRAYIKFDPATPERKAYYSDAEFRAFVEVLCLAASQPTLGVFKSERLLKALLEKRARHIPHMLAERDLVLQRDGSLFVPGFKEWQEGQYPSVAARLEAIEGRRRPMTPAERAFVYRQRKKQRDERDETSHRDAARDARSDRTATETEPDLPRDAASRSEKREGPTSLRDILVNAGVKPELVGGPTA